MSGEKEVMLGAFTKFFNKTDQELVEMMYEEDEDGNLKLKEDAMDMVLGIDEKRVQRIKDEASKIATEKFNDGYKKAQSEVLSKFEKDLREKFGVDSDKAGTDLVDDIVSAASKGGEITEETLKTHPLYLKLEGKKKEEFEQQIKAVKEEYDNYKSNVEREKALYGVRSKARSVFLGLNPVLSEDKERAEGQIDLFLKELEGYGYIPDGDTFVITDSEGNRIEDGHGNPQSFDNFVQNRASRYFDFKVQDDRQSPGNEPGVAGGTKTITREKYNELIAKYEGSGDWESMKTLKDYKVVD